MIKGVSRCAVELNEPDSPFFEKIICFVRPQFADGDTIDLHREAVRVVDGLNADVEETHHGTRYVIKAPSHPGQTAGYTTTSVRPTFAAVPCTSSPPPPPGGLPRWIPLALSAGGGAVAAIVITSMM